MARKALDYEAIQEQFYLEKSKDKSLTIPLFCELHGLVFHTIKKKIKGKIPEGWEPKSEGSDKMDWRAAYSCFLNRQLENNSYTLNAFAKEVGFARGYVGVQFKRLQDDPEFAPLKAEVDRQKKIAQRERRQKKQIIAPSLENLGGESQAAKALIPPQLRESALVRRDQNGRFKRGSRAKSTHATYLEYMGLDEELVAVASEVDPNSLHSEIAAARVQYASLLNYLSLGTEILKTRYEDDDPVKDIDGNAVPLAVELMKLHFGTAEKLRTLEGSIANMVQVSARIARETKLLKIKERESKVLSAETALGMQSEILQRRIENNIPAMDAVKEFELCGLPVPAFLMAEAKRELEAVEPEVDDSGISDEELEQRSLAYMAKQKEIQNEWLPDRQAKIQTLFAHMDAIDNGDIPADTPIPASVTDDGDTPPPPAPDEDDNGDDGAGDEFDDVDEFTSFDDVSDV